MLTLSLDVVVSEFAFVGAAIAPLENTSTVLHALEVVAFIDAPVDPDLFPLPVLLVLFPLACISESRSINSA